MQYINGLRELGYIEYSMFEPGVNTDFQHAGANCGHRFPIIWVEPLLNTAQLEPGNAARVGRKRSQVFVRRSEPYQRLVRHGR